MHHTRVVEFSMLFSCVSGLEFVSCSGTSKKLSLGGVMSTQKHSLQTWDLARFGSVSYIYDFIFITFLIFGLY